MFLICSFRGCYTLGASSRPGGSTVLTAITTYSPNGAIFALAVIRRQACVCSVECSLMNTPERFCFGRADKKYSCVNDTRTSFYVCKYALYTHHTHIRMRRKKWPHAKTSASLLADYMFGQISFVVQRESRQLWWSVSSCLFIISVCE